MGISRIGNGFLVTFPGEAALCPKCGYPFRKKRFFSEGLRASSPCCGVAGPFRSATEADVRAFFEREAERRKFKATDIPKTLVGLIVIALAVALIVWWRVDA